MDKRFHMTQSTMRNGVRNNARADERNRRNDRPRNYDRSRNYERRRENMSPRDFQNREMPSPTQGMENVAPNTAGMPPNNRGGMPPNTMGGMLPNQGWSCNMAGNTQNFPNGPTNYGNSQNQVPASPLLQAVTRFIDHVTPSINPSSR
ncbi:hypothetical protein F3Y22_tig00110429pilonHSYRG00008 [Hibiscus syriacus]|uniref:Uncharacterized protein n=1 Tax=Hibiscus syriacus TaxID=106335 RepID=A0A6A3AM32_HIBSY|nr:hypothetical protein F3Y22_tig00110429pilonHSYRG00008 [Hibiscus syriacus]